MKSTRAFPCHVRGALVSLLALAGWSSALHAGPPYLLGDLLSGPGGSGDSNPSGWIEAGDRTFFQASHHLLGREMYATGGTAGSTFLLADSSPADASASPVPYGVVGGRLLWWAWTGGGRSGFGLAGSLWASDGTPEGTTRLMPAGVAIPDPDPPRRGGVFAGDVLYFFGCSPNECSLWASDGTVAGTRPVQPLSDEPRVTRIDIVAAGDRVFYLDGADLWTYAPGAEGTLLVEGDGTRSPPANLAVVGSTLYFSFEEGGEGEHLWRSDGTVAGTTPVSSLPGGESVWSGHQVAGGVLYFVVDMEGGEGLEIWKSDGTEDGTNPATGFDFDEAIDRRFFARDFLVVGQRIFVQARSDFSSTSDSVWVSDGAPGSTRDLVGCGGTGCRVASRLASVGRRAVFALGFDERLELWSSDGTSAGTGPVGQVCAESCSSGVVELHEVGAELGFVAGGRIWITDGTSGRTRPITLPGQPPVSNFGGVGRLGDCWLFPGHDERGAEPWCSEGPPESVRIVADIERAAPGSGPREFVDAGERTVFAADDESGVPQVWASDGRPGAVHRLTASPFTSGRDLVGTGQFAIYQDPPEPDFLWRTDGTDQGTFPIGRLQRLADVVLRDRIYSFGIQGDVPGIYEIDGAAEGPRLAVPLSRVLGSSSYPTVVGEAIYYIGFVDQGNHALWRSDGTAEGTRLLVSLPEDQRLPQPLAIAELKGRVYFVVHSRSGDDEIWRTDGTPGDTVHVATIPEFLGQDGGPGGGLVAHGGALWFAARNDEPGASLLGAAIYRFTEAGRVAVARSAERVPAPWLTSLGDKLFFVFDDGIHGLEPWWSDGTVAGTAMLSDLHRGGPSHPRELTVAGDRIYFTASSDRYGRELWRADETGEVELVSDLFPGAYSSAPEALAVIGDTLYFAADDGERGREPWALSLDGSGPPDPPDHPFPPPGPFLTSPEIPGFRFKVRISSPAASLAGRAEPDCIPETLCVSGALPGRSEVFLRVVGPKPNGKLWPTLVKFSTSRVEVWIEQLRSREIRYYELPGAAPGFNSLPGLFDRGGFLP